MTTRKEIVAGAAMGVVLGIVGAAWIVRESRAVERDWKLGYEQAMLAPAVALNCGSSTGRILEQQATRLRQESTAAAMLDLVEIHYLRSRVATCEGDALAAQRAMTQARRVCETFRDGCADNYLQVVGGRRLNLLVTPSTAREEDEEGGERTDLDPPEMP